MIRYPSIHYLIKLDQEKFSKAVKDLEEFLLEGTPLDARLQKKYAAAAIDLLRHWIIERIFLSVLKKAENSDNPEIFFWKEVEAIAKRLIEWHSQFYCYQDISGYCDNNARNIAINKFVFEGVHNIGDSKTNAAKKEMAMTKEKEAKGKEVKEKETKEKKKETKEKEAEGKEAIEKEVAKKFLKEFFSPLIQDQYNKSNGIISGYVSSFAACLAEIHLALIDKKGIKAGINKWIKKEAIIKIYELIRDSNRLMWWGKNCNLKKEEEIRNSLKEMGLTDSLQEYLAIYNSQHGIAHTGFFYFCALIAKSFADLNLKFDADPQYILNEIDNKTVRQTTQLLHHTLCYGVVNSGKIERNHPLAYSYISLLVTDKMQSLTEDPSSPSLSNIKVEVEHCFQEIVDEQAILKVKQVFYEGGLLKLRSGLSFDDLFEEEQHEITAAKDSTDNSFYSQADVLFIKAVLDRTFAEKLFTDEIHYNCILRGKNPEDFKRIHKRYVDSEILELPSALNDFNWDGIIVFLKDNPIYIFQVLSLLKTGFSSILKENLNATIKQKTLELIINSELREAKELIFKAIYLLDDDELVLLLKQPAVTRFLKDDQIYILQKRSAVIAKALLEIKILELTQAQLLQIAQTHAVLWRAPPLTSLLNMSSLMTCVFDEKKEIRVAALTAILSDKALYSLFLKTAVLKKASSEKITRFWLEAPLNLKYALLAVPGLIAQVTKNFWGEDFGNFFSSLIETLENYKDMESINKYTELLKKELKRTWEKSDDIQIKIRLLTETSTDILPYLLTLESVKSELQKNQNLLSEFCHQAKIDFILTVAKEIPAVSNYILNSNEDLISSKLQEGDYKYSFLIVLEEFIKELVDPLKTGTVLSSSLYQLLFKESALQNKIIREYVKKPKWKELAKFLSKCAEYATTDLLKDFYNKVLEYSDEIVDRSDDKSRIQLCCTVPQLRKKVLSNIKYRQGIIENSSLIQLKRILIFDNGILAVDIAQRFIYDFQFRKCLLGVEPLVEDNELVQEFFDLLEEKLNEFVKNDFSKEEFIKNLKKRIAEDNCLEKNIQIFFRNENKNKGKEKKKEENDENKNEPSPTPSDRNIIENLTLLSNKYIDSKTKTLAAKKISKENIQIIFKYLKNCSDINLEQILYCSALTSRLSTTHILELQKRNARIAHILLHPPFKIANFLQILRHPFNQLQQKDLLEVAKTRPEAWTDYCLVKLPFISRTWIRKTRLGRMLYGRSYRDDLSGDALAECVFVEDSKVRAAAIQAIAEDQALSKRLISSEFLLQPKHQREFTRFFSETPTHLRGKLLTTTRIKTYIQSLDADNYQQYCRTLLQSATPEKLLQHWQNHWQSKLNLAKGADSFLRAIVESIEARLNEPTQSNKMKKALREAWTRKTLTQRQKLLCSASPAIICALVEFEEIQRTIFELPSSNDLRKAFHKTLENDNEYPFHLVLSQLTELFLTQTTKNLSLIGSLVKLFLSENSSLRKKIFNANHSSLMIGLLRIIETMRHTIVDEIKATIVAEVKKNGIEDYKFEDLLKLSFYLPDLKSIIKYEQDRLLLLANNFTKNNNLRKFILGIEPPEQPKVVEHSLFFLFESLENLSDQKEHIEDIIREMKHVDHFASSISVARVHYEWRRKQDPKYQLTVDDLMLFSVAEHEPFFEKNKKTIMALFMQASELHVKLLLNIFGKKLVKLLVSKINDSKVEFNELLLDAILDQLCPNDLYSLYNETGTCLLIKKRIRENETFHRLILTDENALYFLYCNDRYFHQEIANSPALIKIVLKNKNVDTIYKAALFLPNTDNLSTQADNEIMHFELLENNLAIRQAIVDDPIILEKLLLNTPMFNLMELLINENDQELKSKLFARLAEFYLDTEYCRCRVNTYPQLLKELLTYVPDELLPKFKDILLHFLTIPIMDEKDEKLQRKLFLQLAKLYLSDDEDIRYRVNKSSQLLIGLLAHTSGLDFFDQIIPKIPPRQMLEVCLSDNSNALGLREVLRQDKFKTKLEALLDTASTTEQKSLDLFLRQGIDIREFKSINLFFDRVNITPQAKDSADEEPYRCIAVGVA